MPTRRTPDGGYQWGEHGTVYHGKGAKEKADRQGRAIKAAESARARKKGKVRGKR